ncbi:hypothetical protein OIU35_13345 [Boseaceae bacterium BT-24-1]|nr:hypothetical protein [Boseaceae bacterium BT-24-1]
MRHARTIPGQSRRIANFILAWWNADDLGGFDLADIFAVDGTIGQDMASVFTWLAGRSVAEYPDAYRAEIETIIRLWRPEIWARAAQTA